MEVDTNVSESDIGGVKEGNPASFTVEAYPDRPFEGTVVQRRQAPQTLQNVVTFDVVVGVANPDLLLMPGMTATTKIVTAQRDNVLRRPIRRCVTRQPMRLPPHRRRRQAGRRGSGQLWVLVNGKPVRRCRPCCSDRTTGSPGLSSSPSTISVKLSSSSPSVTARRTGLPLTRTQSCPLPRRPACRRRRCGGSRIGWRVTQRLIGHAKDIVALGGDNLGRGGHARHEQQVRVGNADHDIVAPRSEAFAAPAAAGRRCPRTSGRDRPRP